MAIRQIFKISFKTCFNQVAWFNLNTFLSYNATIKQGLSGLFSPALAEPLRKETFAEAMARLKMTEADLAQIKQRYFLLAMLFLILGLAVLIFSFYLLFFSSFHGWLIGMAASALFFSQAFQYHFWYFQIKFRKLGCTFKEWRQGKPDKDSTT